MPRLESELEMLKVTQVKSRINRKKDHKATLDALGITRMNQTVYHEDTATIRGMVRKVRYMVQVEVVDVKDRVAVKPKLVVVGQAGPKPKVESAPVAVKAPVESEVKAEAKPAAAKTTAAPKPAAAKPAAAKITAAAKPAAAKPAAAKTAAAKTAAAKTATAAKPAAPKAATAVKPKAETATKPKTVAKPKAESKDKE
jgi:ribosomal protein L30